MVNYQNGLIYVIRQRGGEVFYVGSTCNERDRRYKHKHSTININSKKYNRKVYKHIRSIGGWEMVIMEKLHNFPCDSKQELCREEGRVQKEFIGRGINLQNSDIAGRTKNEYTKDTSIFRKKYKNEYYCKNKDKVKEKANNYYKNNKNEILRKIQERNKIIVTCECGKTIKKNSITSHRKSKTHLALIANA